MTDSAAPSSPVVFARQRSASPQSSIVIDISAPLDDPPAATTITPSTTLDPEGEDLDKTAVAIGGDADGNESAEKLTEMDTDAKTEEPTTPPLRNSAVSMRVLGVNYFPPVKEEEETVHPLRLDISPPSPRDWEQGGDLVDEDVGEWNLKAEPGRPMSFRHQQEISAVRRTRPPVSAYPFGPPPPDAAFGTDPVGRLGVHHPREIVRVERDYSGGEIVQFVPAYPLEFEGRVSPTQFLETINSFNEILISAYSLRHGFVDNVLDILTLHVSKLLISTHYDREMKRLRQEMDRLNEEIYNPAGLNILWPRRVGFLFLEIEYY